MSTEEIVREFVRAHDDVMDRRRERDRANEALPKAEVRLAAATKALKQHGISAPIVIDSGTRVITFKPGNPVGTYEPVIDKAIVVAPPRGMPVSA